MSLLFIGATQLPIVPQYTQASACTAERVCNSCRQPGHLVKDCTNPPVCNNCFESGHIAKECSGTALCHKCKKPDHRASACPN